MKKILAIGNSFSQDATAYLHAMAKTCGIETTVVNLYIGGCSLKRHDENIKNDATEYIYERNGESTGKYVSIKETLKEDDWDFVTLQQASHDSGLEETYFPYIKNLSEYVKTYAPHAKQRLHQTWAYEIDSTHEGFANYNNNQLQMFGALQSAYKKAADRLNLPIIPCGEAIQRLRTLPEFDYANSGKSLCRDGFHLHLIYGRYAAAAVWLKKILNESPANSSFLPPSIEGEVCDERLIALIQAEIA